MHYNNVIWAFLKCYTASAKILIWDSENCSTHCTVQLSGQLHNSGHSFVLNAEYSTEWTVRCASGIVCSTEYTVRCAMCSTECSVQQTVQSAQCGVWCAVHTVYYTVDGRVLLITPSIWSELVPLVFVFHFLHSFRNTFCFWFATTPSAICNLFWFQCEFQWENDHKSFFGNKIC